MQVVFQRVKVKVKCWVFFIPKCNDDLIIVYLRCNFTVECFFKKKPLTEIFYSQVSNVVRHVYSQEFT